MTQQKSSVITRTIQTKAIRTVETVTSTIRLIDSFEMISGRCSVGAPVGDTVGAIVGALVGEKVGALVAGQVHT